MIADLIKFGAYAYGVKYAYNEYVKKSEGVLDTVSKIARDALNKPWELFESAQGNFSEAQLCFEKIDQDKAANIQRSFLNPLKYLSPLISGANSVSCNRHIAYGAGYLAASLAVSYGVFQAARKITTCLRQIQNGVSWMQQLVSEKRKTMLEKTPANAIEPALDNQGGYLDQMQEFGQIYKKFVGKIPVELSNVFLKGDLPVVALKTTLASDALIAQLKQENLQIRSLELSPEGNCLMVHLQTQSAMDFCIEF